MSTSTTQWTTMPTADLIQGGELPEADPELVADIEQNGIIDPLYVATDDGRTRIYDGLHRLAAAHTLGLTEVPITHRPVIRLSALTPHPDNVREDYHLTQAFMDSLVADGIQVPLLIQRMEDGTVQINEGNRRYYAAQEANLTHVPYVWDERDTAGQYLTQVSTAHHRHGLTVHEEANALFKAYQAGAKIGRVAKAAGMKQKEARTALRVGGSAAAAKTAAAHPHEWTLEDLAWLAKLEEVAPEEAAKITAQAEASPQSTRWQIRRALTAAENNRQAEAHRAELEQAGARIVPEYELSPRARRLATLPGASEDEHAATCQGHVWVHQAGAARYRQYCANVILYGHVTEAPQEQGTGNQHSKEETAAARRAVRAGNLDWDTATRIRREWLTKFIGRRHTKATTDAMTRIVTRAMLGADRTLSGEMYKEPATAILAHLLGMDEDTSRDDIAAKASADPRRQPALMFAVLAAAYETRMVRHAWRRDHTHNAALTEPAAHWLQILTECGYEPAPIEIATRDGHEYQPEQD